MSTESYVIKLTGDQHSSLVEFFQSKQWPLEIQTLDRYIAMQDAAEDYTTSEQMIARENGLPVESETPPPRMSLQCKPVRKAEGTSIKHDKVKKTFNSMKDIGTDYNVRRRTKPKEDPRSSAKVEARNQGNKWRQSTWHSGDDEQEVTSNLAVKHYCVADDKTIKVITKLSTSHVHNVSHVPVRIVLLVDRSGSMLHKFGRDGQHSKITKVKHFAKQLVAGLDDGDQVALVTFGDSGEVFFPLEKLNKTSRSRLTELLNKLDKGSMSRETNLSSGLRMALKVFYNATKSEDEYISTKNSILVFSDGDINAGTVDTNNLLHEVRQNIRQMVPKLDDSQNQWVTISVVTTGTSISEQAYMLSKTCSSEAYYYIGNDAEDPEAELFIPVLLRKTAVAWNVSCVIEAFHGTTFIDDKCSKDNRVRLRRSLSGRAKTSEKAYFLYDFPAGHSKQVGVCAAWDASSRFDGLNDDEKILSVRTEFTNINGERFWQEQTITKADILKAASGDVDAEANTEAYKHDMRLVSGDVLRSAAEWAKSGNKSKCQGVMRDGQKSLQALLNDYGAKAQEQRNSTVLKTELTSYVKGVVDNMGALIDSIEKASTGVAWNRIKAVSTAITRESPNVSETVLDDDLLCPLPDISFLETGALKDPLDRLQEKKKHNKRITFGNLDALLEGMENQTYGST